MPSHRDHIQTNPQNRIPSNNTPQHTFQPRQPFQNPNPTNTFQPRQTYNNNSTPLTNRNNYTNTPNNPNNQNQRFQNNQNTPISNTQTNDRSKPYPQRYMNAQLSDELENDTQDEIEHSLFTYARFDEDIMQQEQQEQQTNQTDIPSDFA